MVLRVTGLLEARRLAFAAERIACRRCDLRRVRAGPWLQRS